MVRWPEFSTEPMGSPKGDFQDFAGNTNVAFCGLWYVLKRLWPPDSVPVRLRKMSYVKLRELLGIYN
jgi:hypothetical protein